MYLSEDRLKQLEKLKALSKEFYDLSYEFRDDLIEESLGYLPDGPKKEIMGKDLFSEYYEMEKKCFYTKPNKKNFELFTLFANKVVIELKMKELQKEKKK